MIFDFFCSSFHRTFLQHQCIHTGLNGCAPTDFLTTYSNRSIKIGVESPSHDASRLDEGITPLSFRHIHRGHCGQDTLAPAVPPTVSYITAHHARRIKHTCSSKYQYLSANCLESTLIKRQKARGMLAPLLLTSAGCHRGPTPIVLR